jgi:hypothetical protein
MLAYRRERPAEPWPIISGNTRACAPNCNPPPLCKLCNFRSHFPLSFFLHEIDSFTLTPPRMRMIVDAFKETLELGLEKPKQVVVRFRSLGLDLDPSLRLEPGIVERDNLPTLPILLIRNVKRGPNCVAPGPGDGPSLGPTSACTMREHSYHSQRQSYVMLTKRDANSP